MEYYYSAIKNKDIMNFAGKWMELANILSEITQTEKDMRRMYSLISGY
jgi:lipocalin